MADLSQSETSSNHAPWCSSVHPGQPCPAENEAVPPRLTAEEREAVIENMASEGQALAVRWGHQPWSDSWARLVAETLLEEVVSSDWRCECGDLNRSHESGCYRCGAGKPEAETQRAASACSEPRPGVGAEPDRTGSGDS